MNYQKQEENMEIIKIGFLGIAGVLLAVYFKSVKSEYGIYIGTATGLLIFFCAMKNLTFFMEQMRLLSIFSEEENGFLGILFKVVGITYVCEFCAGICKDAGYSAISSQLQIFGKVMVLLTGLPILLSVIRTIENFRG